MSETTNMMNMRPPAEAYAGHAGDAGAEYYRAYYRELVAGHANLIESGRRLDVIKAERRRARREKCLRGSSRRRAF